MPTLYVHGTADTVVVGLGLEREDTCPGALFNSGACMVMAGEGGLIQRPWVHRAGWLQAEAI